MEDNTLKFKEGQYILELKRYIDSTYTQHYSNKSGLQVQEILKDLEIGKEFCQGNAIKYLMRYGKKKGYNRADLLKKELGVFTYQDLMNLFPNRYLDKTKYYKII